jgi:hypothetical protein
LTLSTAAVGWAWVVWVADSKNKLAQKINDSTRSEFLWFCAVLDSVVVWANFTSPGSSVSGGLKISWQIFQTIFRTCLQCEQLVAAVAMVFAPMMDSIVSVVVRFGCCSCWTGSIRIRNWLARLLILRLHIAGWDPPILPNRVSFANMSKSTSVIHIHSWSSSRSMCVYTAHIWRASHEIWRVHFERLEYSTNNICFHFWQYKLWPTRPSLWFALFATYWIAVENCGWNTIRQFHIGLNVALE